MTTRSLLLVILMIGLSHRDSVATNDDALLNRWLEKQASITNWSADLQQTRTLKSITQPLVSPGRVWFSAPNQFRWELGTPAQTIAVRQPAQLLVIYPKFKRVEKYGMAEGASGPWKDALALLEAGFPRDRKDLDNRFNVKSVNAKDETTEVILEPKSPGARRMMPQVKIVFGTKDLDLRATEMQFADGSTMRNDFTNAKINEALPKDIFTPEIPKEFRVIEPLNSKKVPLK